MKSNLLIVLFLVLFAACATIDKEESFLFDQVRFEEQVSKREVKTEESLGYPKRVVRKISVLKDSATQINYSTKSTRKFDNEGVYVLQVNTCDTVKLDKFQHKFVQSEFNIGGAFVRPKTAIPLVESSKKLTFKTDGSCVESSIVFCSDSPCSTLYEKTGDYRVINDTINVTLYLSRSWFSGHRHLLQLKDVQWHVAQPTSYQYMLTEKSDSLMMYNKAQNKMELYLVACDTIQMRSN